MTKPGRRPIPTELKRQAGNPGKRPLNENEPQPVRGAPEIPPHLTGLAAETWDWLCDRLAELNLLGTSDMVIMALFCGAWARYVANYEAVEKYGTVFVSTKQHKDGGETKTPYIGPYLNIEAMLSKQLTQYSAAMGLGPAWRASVTKIPGPDIPEGKSRFFKVVG